MTARRRALALAAAALALAGCSDEDNTLAPGQRVPTPGTYGYLAIVERSDTLPADTLQGTLVISVAHQDSLVARWQVQGFQGGNHRGVWNINAYVLPATPTRFPGTLTHRLWRGSAGSLQCVASYQHVVSGDTIASSNGCSVLPGS